MFFGGPQAQIQKWQAPAMRVCCLLRGIGYRSMAGSRAVSGHKPHKLHLSSREQPIIRSCQSKWPGACWFWILLLLFQHSSCLAAPSRQPRSVRTHSGAEKAGRSSSKVHVRLRETPSSSVGIPPPQFSFHVSHFPFRGKFSLS